MTIATQEKPKSRRGGARPGAGMPAGYVKPQERVDYDVARARNELAKAELNELDLAIKRGEFVDRGSVREMAATALATLAQTLRSVPDNIERKMGASPEIAVEVGELIDNALDDIANAFDALLMQAEDEPMEGGDDADLQ